MNITPINVNQKQNQKSFGMKLQAVDEAAAKLFAQWIPEDVFRKLEPEIEGITDVDGKNFVARITKLKDWVLEIATSSESVHLSQDISKNTVHPNSPVIEDNLIPTLLELKNKVDKPILEKRYIRALLEPKIDTY